MGYANGKVPPTVLRTVAPSISLLSAVGSAYLNMQLIARLDTGESVKAISGYRDLALQRLFYAAAHGDKNAAKQANLDPNSHIAVAAPGHSSHGYGDRVDILWNGHSPSESDIAFAKRYGFTREFGADDPNHFQHDKRTAISGVRSYDKIRLVARELNSLHLGKSTMAEHSGQRDEAFIWLVQHYGHMKKWYPVACKEDGITGHYTELTLDTAWNHLKVA